MPRFTSGLTRNSFQPRRAKRLSEWIAITSNANLSVAANTKVLFFSFSAAALEPVLPGTLIRMHGLLTFNSDQVVATERPLGAFGIGIVGEEARAAGVASMPGPYDNAADERWMYHTFMSSTFILTSADAWEFREDRILVDTKSMRKMESDDAIVAVAEVGSAAVGALINCQLRLLFLLH